MPDIDLPAPGEDPNWAPKLNTAIKLVSDGTDAVAETVSNLGLDNLPGPGKVPFPKLPTVELDDRYVNGASSKMYSALQAKANTGTDATTELNAFFHLFQDGYKEVEVSGKYVANTGLDITPPKETVPDGTYPDGTPRFKTQFVGTGGKIKFVAGADIQAKGGISCYGEWKFAGFVHPEGAIRGTRLLKVEDGTQFSIGDWIFVGSGDRLTRISDFNFHGAMRKVTGVSGDTLTVDDTWNRNMSAPPRVNYFAKVTVAGVEGNTINVDRAETFKVGDVVQLREWPRTPIATGRTVTARDTTAGAHTITFSGAAVTTTTTQYLIKTGGVLGADEPISEIYAPGAYIMKCLLAPQVIVELDEGTAVLGKGFYNPTVDGTGSNLIRMELVDSPQIIGKGVVGDHPRGAIVISNSPNGIVSCGVRNIWNFEDGAGGGSGYLINWEGACPNGIVTDEAVLDHGRHGSTTNTGQNVRISKEDFDLFANPATRNQVQYKRRATSGPTFGAAGEPEMLHVEPREVMHMIANGLDTHKPGFGTVIVVKNVHDNPGGGVQNRADNTRIFFEGKIADSGSSGLVIASSVDPAYPTEIFNGAVENTRGNNSDNYAILGSANGYNCSSLGNNPADSGYGWDFGSSARGTWRGGRVADVDSVARFAGTGVRFIDLDIDWATVTRPHVYTGTGANGDNQFVYSDAPFGIPLPTETRYKTGPFYGRGTPSTIGLTNQYGHIIQLRPQLVTSLAVRVATAVAGSSVKIALFKFNPMGNTLQDVILAEGTVTTATTGLRSATLATPVRIYGGLYWIGVMSLGAAAILNGGNLQQNEMIADADQLGFYTGQGLYKPNDGAGGWGSWNGAGGALNSTAPILMVGSKLK